MSVALKIASFYLGFVGFSGFLFSQLFFGVFSLQASFTGTTSLATAIGAFKLADRSITNLQWIVWVSVSALLGVILDAANYYLSNPMPGNYYAWHLIGPFAACIVFVGIVALARSTSSTPE